MSETKDSGSDKPKVLILGGTGFIGRNLVKYLTDNELVETHTCICHNIT